MMRKAWMAIALVVWLMVLTFNGIAVSALPNHVVAGGVFGPGGDMSSGPANPANAAGMVFYSTSQPSYSVLTGADSYTPASGTEPALFGKDVGATWNWAAGDEMVAVIETTRGVNGWNSANSTTSIDALLQTGATVQDIGNAELEAFPTVTLIAGASNVLASWLRLTDANGNIVSYSLYRTPGAGTPIATVPTGPTMTHNDIGLAPGQYCYTVQVNYRRDLSSAVYGTTGRSERVCRTLTGSGGNTPPTAAVTAPTAGVCATGGSTLTIGWTMSDAETAVMSLRVWLNYTVGATVTPIAGVQGMSGLSSPASYAWTTPMINNANVMISLVVADGAGATATSTSPSFTIDSTAPTATMTQPAVGATSVALDGTVVISFSEAMARTATQGAISFTPAVTGLTFTWSVGDTVLTVGHAAFAASTQYTLTVSTAARDACNPGLDLASAYTASFNTAATTGQPPPPLGIDPLWILMAIIVVVLVVVGLLLMRRRKPAPAPAPETPPEAPPAESYEESSPPEEGAGPPNNQ